MTVHVLSANQPANRFYTGGRQIAQFRGHPQRSSHEPEDWVASVTTVSGEDKVGLTRLPTGELLRDAVRLDPAAWLGPEHVAAYGNDTGLLVKLLDAGQRLPVHAHPDVAFASRHFGLDHGKTEAWIFLEPATVHLGFARDVASNELAAWVDEQSVEEMLGAMHALSVEAGDAILVPAGMPHAIGEGAFLVELQEPTDLSILMEWSDFIDDPAQGHLGLGFDTALAAITRRAWSRDEIERLRHARRDDDGPLLPAARDFFRADRHRGTATWEPGYSVIVVVHGEGELIDGRGTLTHLTAGSTAVVPFSAGECHWSATAATHVLRCRPPDARTPLWEPARRPDGLEATTTIRP